MSLGSPTEEGGSAALVGRVARSGAWNVLGYLVTASSALIISVIVGRRLGPAGFGEYSYFIWLVRMTVAIGVLGIPAASARMVSSFLGASDRAGAKGVFRYALRFQLLLTPFLFLVTGVLVWLRSSDLFLAFELGVAASFLAFVWIYEQTLGGIRRYDLVARNAFVLAVFQLVVLGIALVVGARLLGFIHVYAVSALGSMIVWGGVTVWAFASWQVEPIDRETSREFNKLAILFALVSLSDTILWGRPEIFFLERFYSEEQVGLYSAGLFLATLTSSLPLIASRVLTPEFSWLRGGGNEEQLRRGFPVVCVYVSLIAIPLGIGGAMVARDLLLAAYGASFAAAAMPAMILIAGSTFVAVAGPASSATVTGPDPGFMAKLSGAFAALNILLDLVLIPRFAMIGAAAATIASQAVTIVIVVFYVWRKMGLVYPVKKMGLITVSACVSSGVGRILASGSEGLGALAISVPVSVVIYLILVRLFGVVTLTEIRAGLLGSK